MKLLKPYAYLFIALLAMGCSMLRENTNYEMVSGQYKSKVKGKSEKFWVQLNDTLVQLYTYQNKKHVNKSNPFIFSFNENAVTDPTSSLRLSKHTLDIDVVTIPFKYRPSLKVFPNQLNTPFSAAVFAGVRNDYYHFFFRPNPVGEQKRELKNFGFSFGLFGGFGSTAVNPSTTQNQISSEYDGFVLMSGVAALVAVNKLTFGFGLGRDILLDRNRKYWIYQHKPWIGLTVGLNIN